jgi:hypothetical protein
LFFISVSNPLSNLVINHDRKTTESDSTYMTCDVFKFGSDQSPPKLL